MLRRFVLPNCKRTRLTSRRGWTKVQKNASKGKTSPSPRFQTLMRRLSQAGFDKGFVRPALLPDWWDETCDQDPDLLPDFEIRVARFLGMPLTSIRDSDTALAIPQFPGAKLRRVRDVDGERLKPAIHLAVRIAEATVRSLRDPTSQPVIPPIDGIEWRKKIESNGSALTLDQMLGDLWQRGIPVVPLEIIPAPSFQAIACIVEDRPVILLGYKYNEPGRVAFLLAHEAGHLAVGDCDSDHLVLDGEEGIVDDADIEVNADQYAHDVLVGEKQIPELESREFKGIAKESAEQERLTGIDAGIIIADWASRTRDYAKATLALKALYRSSGGRQQIGRYFNSRVDVASATQSDRDLLRCVYGVSNLYETVG